MKSGRLFERTVFHCVNIPTLAVEKLTIIYEFLRGAVCGAEIYNSLQSLTDYLLLHWRYHGMGVPASHSRTCSQPLN